MKAFQCDKCGKFFTRKRRALEKGISFDGQRGPRTLSVDLLYRCVHTKAKRGTGFQEVFDYGHKADFCDNCLLWLIEEYKGGIMVAIGREVDVTEDTRECASHQA